MYGSNSDVDSKRFLSLEGGQRSEAMMCESYFTTVMGKILHFLMDESIEEEQKEKQLQVNLYTVFEKNLKTTFAVRM